MTWFDERQSLNQLEFTAFNNYFIRATLVFLSTLLLSACTLGPDFVRPDSPDTKNYTSGTPLKSAGEQSIVMGKEIPAQWWMLFRSPPLAALIDKALKHSPDLQAAQAALTQASELATAKESALFPTVDSSFSGVRQQTTGSQFGRPDAAGTLFNLFNTSVKVSYTLDVFGAVQRQLEGLMAEADYQRFQSEGAFLTLSANIVTTAIQEAALRAQISTTEELIKARVEQLTIIKQQVESGGASQVDVLTQQAVLEQERTALPPLQKQLMQARHRLTVLVGDLPSNDLAAQFTLADLQLPLELPLSIPSKLVAQRPDIRAQEALLHAANAKIGVITAKMFPDFTISANIGSIATRLGDLFIPGSAIWSTGLNLLQPIFHGAEDIHQRRAAIAAYDAAAARYRSTVLLALQNVADSLTALESDANAVKAQTAAEQAALASLELSRSQYQVGATSYLALLTAQNSYQQARLGQIKAQAIRLADTAALFQALGGGWWNRADLARTLAAQQKKPETTSFLPFFDWSFIK
jgi:NodT family efflux transporter outer membrane factor (OMF) lipoprotein